MKAPFSLVPPATSYNQTTPKKTAAITKKYDGNVDYIIHAASPAGAVHRYDGPTAAFDANVTGCRNMLALAEKKGVGVLLVSSIDIYGRIPGCGRLHIDFISQILTQNEIILKGDGTPRRTFLYVTDAVTGMLTVLLEGKSGEAYNLCSENCEASVLELAQMMASCAADRQVKISFNMETRKTDPAVTQVVFTVCGCSDKIRSLGWKQEVPLKEACQRMMAYYGGAVM